MATNFYLADKRYMTHSEIEMAREFDDNAFVCQKIAKGGTFIYSLGVHPVILYNLPSDVTLINNNNNLEIENVGDLVEALGRKDTILQMPAERQAEHNEALKQWLLSRPDLGGWSIFRHEKKAVADGTHVEDLYPSQPTAEQYILRTLKAKK